MPDRRKSRHRTARTGLAARLLAQVRLDAATIVFALAALAYLCAAMASGLDREFEKRPSGLYVLGWPLPEYLSLARTRNALVDKDYDRALAAARAAIRTSPLDMHSVGALGFAMQAVGKEAEAEPAYKVAATLEPSPFATARWLKGSDAALAGFEQFNRANLAKDRDGDLVFMAKSAWDVGYQQEKNPDVTFSATKER